MLPDIFKPCCTDLISNIDHYFFVDDVKSLSLPGSYHEKIVHLGNSLKGFTRLKHLDLSRNGISILDVSSSFFLIELTGFFSLVL